jgi:hypothetical protein
MWLVDVSGCVSFHPTSRPGSFRARRVRQPHCALGPSRGVSKNSPDRFTTCRTMDIVNRPRIYTAILREHFEQHRQMAFVNLPRQVGKIWVSKLVGDSGRRLFQLGQYR